MENRVKLLIVDDERVALRNLEYVMKNEGYDVVATQSGSNAIRHLDEQEFDVVLTDMRMEKVDGMQVLKKCRELHPDTEIIMITAYATLESAVDTMKLGAYTYIAKPAKLDELRKAVREAVKKVAMKKEQRHLKEQLKGYRGAATIITQDLALRKPLETARQIALADTNVFITGESGTGKKLFARYIHDNSRRSEGPFYTINCGALPEELLAYELFGHEKDMLGDPSPRKKGVIEASSGGTILLCDVMAMPPSLQVKLLQVLEDKEGMRIGGIKPFKVDVRFIATANHVPVEAAREEPFRQDLYFRLNVVSLHLPPLAERRDDIPLLSYFFLQKHATGMNRSVSELSTDALSLLMNYNFPGNVRELENIIERGVALTNDGTIEPAHLPDNLRELDIRTFKKKEGKIPSLEEQEIAYIKWVLNEVAGNKTLAAQVLGIDRVSLWRKLKKYRLEGSREDLLTGAGGAGTPPAEPETAGD
jgi:DNA-binding NtrC family response regulator